MVAGSVRLSGRSVSDLNVAAAPLYIQLFLHQGRNWAGKNVSCTLYSGHNALFLPNKSFNTLYSGHDETQPVTDLGIGIGIRMTLKSRSMCALQLPAE